MTNNYMKKLPFIKLYHGYGHSGNLVIYGHVFKHKPRLYKTSARPGFASNIIELFKLFNVRTLAGARLEAVFEGQVMHTQTEYDGFFKFEYTPAQAVSAGWHTITVQLIQEQQPLCSATGKIFVPHLSQYAFISDIDDTIMRSFSSTIFRRLYELLSRGPQRRRLFDETALHYGLLAQAQTNDALPNPFFYVSSSEWNLYDYLQQVFTKHQLPPGIFLLNQIKRWYELAGTGKTNHEGKLMRIARILKAFPKQRFVLLGDNSQRDPQIYHSIIEKHAAQIHAVYIRNVRSSQTANTAALMGQMAALGVHTCLFTTSKQAIAHGQQIGLIQV
jgi:phosphatidate phosphatase APP1